MNLPPPLPTLIREFAPFSSDCQFLANGVAVQSRLLSGIAYDDDQTILQLKFRGGTVYQYCKVPRQTYQDLLQADSKGAYFNRHIRNVFRCIRLGTPEVAPHSKSAAPR